MPSDYIQVKVGKLPGAVTEIALNGSRTVADALTAANLNPAGFQIKVNGGDATLETTLEGGETVFLVKKIKGNAGDYITVKVGKLPGAVTEIALNGSRTVADALTAAALDPKGFQVKVDGSDAEMDTELSQGSTVFLVKKIKGN